MKIDLLFLKPTSNTTCLTLYYKTNNFFFENSFEYNQLFECKKYYSSSQFLYLRVPQGSLGFLWCSLGVPLEFFGVPLEFLWSSLGVPLEFFGLPWRSLGFLRVSLLDFFRVPWRSFQVSLKRSQALQVSSVSSLVS